MKLQNFQKLQYLSMGNDMMQEKIEKGSMQYITYFLLCLYVCIFMFVLILLFIAYDTVFHFSFVFVQYSDMQ